MFVYGTNQHSKSPAPEINMVFSPPNLHKLNRSVMAVLDTGSVVTGIPELLLEGFPYGPIARTRKPVVTISGKEEFRNFYFLDVKLSNCKLY